MSKLHRTILIVLLTSVIIYAMPSIYKVANATWIDMKHGMVDGWKN